MCMYHIDSVVRISASVCAYAYPYLLVWYAVLILVYMKLLQMSSLVNMLVIFVYTLSRIPPFQSKTYKLIRILFNMLKNDAFLSSYILLIEHGISPFFPLC